MGSVEGEPPASNKVVLVFGSRGSTGNGALRRQSVRAKNTVLLFFLAFYREIDVHLSGRRETREGFWFQRAWNNGLLGRFAVATD